MFHHQRLMHKTNFFAELTVILSVVIMFATSFKFNLRLQRFNYSPQVSCFAKKPSILATSLDCISKQAEMITKNNIREKENAGIRVIRDDIDILILWKTSNVALSDKELLVRPASEPVMNWIKGYLPGYTPTVVSPNLLSSDISGIVLVAKTKIGLEFFRKSVERNLMNVTYEAVLHETAGGFNYIGTDTIETLQQDRVPNRLAKLNEYIMEAFKDTEGESCVTLLNATNSGTYGKLYSVRIRLLGLGVSPKAYPDLIADGLLSAGMTYAKDGKTPFISLVNIGINEGQEVDLNNSEGDVLITSEKAPSKFMKLMRREAILFERLKESSAESSDVDKAEGKKISMEEVKSVDFFDLLIKVPDSALKPRASSGVLVHEAVSEALELHSKYLLHQSSTQNQESEASTATTTAADIVVLSTANDTGRVIRILDLGCGGGALLLATLSELDKHKLHRLNKEDSPISSIPHKELYDDVISTQNIKHSNRHGPNVGQLRLNVIGVGVDLDSNALRYAEMNANDANQTACGWMSADFGQLHSLEVRTRLVDTVIKCETQRGLENTDNNIQNTDAISNTEVREVDNERGGQGLFDIILCNPPFLSSKATAGRVTSEGQRVLVGGQTGMEPYIAICKSVALGCNIDLIKNDKIADNDIDSNCSSRSSSSSNSSSTGSNNDKIYGNSDSGGSNSNNNSNSSKKKDSSSNSDISSGYSSSISNQAVTAIRSEGIKRKSLLGRVKLKSLSSSNAAIAAVPAAVAGVDREGEKPSQEKTSKDDVVAAASSAIVESKVDYTMISNSIVKKAFLSSLPLLSSNGIIIFQVPGGEGGWSDVSRAINQLKLGFSISVLNDERGVKRCVVLRKSKD